MSRNLLLGVCLLSLAWGACASQHCTMRSLDLDVYGHYSKALILEFCLKESLSSECALIQREIVSENPEIYLFRGGKQVLAVYKTRDIYTYAALDRDKDGHLQPLARGILFSEKDEFVQIFVEQGLM